MAAKKIKRRGNGAQTKPEQALLFYFNRFFKSPLVIGAVAVIVGIFALFLWLNNQSQVGTVNLCVAATNCNYYN